MVLKSVSRLGDCRLCDLSRVAEEEEVVGCLCCGKSKA